MLKKKIYWQSALFPNTYYLSRIFSIAQYTEFLKDEQMWYNKKNEYLKYTYFQWHERRKQRLKLGKEQRLLVYEDKNAKAES